MRQCENIFVFIDLTKSIGSDLGGQCPPGPPQTPPMLTSRYYDVGCIWVQVTLVGTRFNFST